MAVQARRTSAGSRGHHLSSPGDTNRSSPPRCDPADNPACLSRLRPPASHRHSALARIERKKDVIAPKSVRLH
jgi:hypothetical protein